MRFASRRISSHNVPLQEIVAHEKSVQTYGDWFTRFIKTVPAKATGELLAKK